MHFYLIIIISNNLSFLLKSGSLIHEIPINTPNEEKTEQLKDDSVGKEVVTSNCSDQTSLQCQSPRDFS